jgi:hypothetical protein
MFEDKPRGVTIRGCSNQDDYFDKHLGISGRTIRSMFAEMGKTDQRFAELADLQRVARRNQFIDEAESSHLLPKLQELSSSL